MDCIIIRDLQARCIIGVDEEERREKQAVVINVALWIDLRKPSQNDLFEDTLDYRALKYRILDAVENSDFRLIEALAGRVAEICLGDPMVEKVQVTVDKPGALTSARSVAVEISRERGLSNERPSAC